MLFVNESFKDYLRTIRSLSPQADSYSHNCWFRAFGTENYIMLDLVGNVDSIGQRHIYEVKYLIKVPLDENQYVFNHLITTKSVWVSFEEFFENLPDDAKLEFMFHLNIFTRQNVIKS